METVDLDKILISLPYIQGTTQCKPLAMFEDTDPYLIHTTIDFFLLEEQSQAHRSMFMARKPLPGK